MDWEVFVITIIFPLYACSLIESVMSAHFTGWNLPTNATI